MRRWRLALAAAVTVLLIAGPGVALAGWAGLGTGSAHSRAESMPAGNTPNVSVTGRNATVDWSASAFPDSTPVNGYRLERYDAVSGVPQGVGAPCDVIVTPLTCTEAATPPGLWTYAVTPRHGGWLGAESPQSASVTIAAPSLAFTSPTTITTFPTTLAGDIASFATGETVEFRLDDPATGSVLAGTVTTSPIPMNGTSAVTVTIPSGTSGGAHTVYAVGSLGTVAGAGIIVDVDESAPTVSAAVIGKTQGGTPGFIRQGGTYYVFANVTDAGSPPSGVTVVTANVSTVTTGLIAAPLVSGSYSVGGVSYGYRTLSLAASSPLAAGAKAFSITAVDAKANSVTQGGFTVTVDNTGPAAADAQTTNVGGGTAGRAETGDTVALTFTEQMDPASIMAGWDGSAANVTLRLNQHGGGDRVQVWNGTNTTQLEFGEVWLGRSDYTTANVTFTTSTMVMTGVTVTITLGAPSGTVGTAGGTGTMMWNPSTVATDRAANACSNTNVNESGAADFDF